MKTDQLAVILYTFRDHITTPQGFSETIAKLAQMGFRAVQVSGMKPDVLPAAEIRKICADHGIAICATHEPGPEILERTDAVADRLETLGCKYTAYPFPQDVDLADETTLARWLGDLERATARLRERGLRLCYHNHNNEFIKCGGSLVFDRIYGETSIDAEIDTYWVQAGGSSPLHWVERLAAQGRLPLLHLKDFAVYPPREQRFAPIGEGNLDFPPILQAALSGGCEWFIIEQDQTYGDDPFDCVARSFQYLRNLEVD